MFVFCLIIFTFIDNSDFPLVYFYAIFDDTFIHSFALVSSVSSYIAVDTLNQILPTIKSKIVNGQFTYRI